MDFLTQSVHRCPYCGFEASLEYFATWESENKRGLLGKDLEGYIMILCPRCEKHIKFDPLDNAFMAEERHAHPLNLDQVRCILRKKAVNVLPIWIIVIIIIAVWSPFDNVWLRLLITGVISLIALRVSIPNIRLIGDMANFIGYYNRAVKNGLIVAVIGVFSAMYLAVAIFFSLPFPTIAAILSCLCSIMNGMLGKDWREDN